MSNAIKELLLLFLLAQISIDRQSQSFSFPLKKPACITVLFSVCSFNKLRTFHNKVQHKLIYLNKELQGMAMASYCLSLP
jgi:hypothetical protein